MKKEKKVIVIIFGRKDGFGIPESDLIKLPKSYLSFFGKSFSEIHPERVSENLALYFIKDYSGIGVQNPIYEIHKSETKKIYFIELFTYANSFRIETLTCILQTLIKEEKYNPDVDQLYYLCHGSDFGKSGFIEGPIDAEEKDKIIKSINDLPIFNKIKPENFFIATFYHEPPSRIFSAIKEKILSQQLNLLNINELLKSFDKEKLKEPKKKLINTFLPLAIDMQGLSQMSNNERRKQYQEEIILDINLNCDKIIKEWNEIKKVLAIDSNQEILSDEYQLSQEQKDKIKFPLERGSSGFSKDELIKLFEKDSWPEDEFLPKWLEQAVDILEKKIEGNSNQ